MGANEDGGGGGGAGGRTGTAVERVKAEFGFSRKTSKAQYVGPGSYTPRVTLSKPNYANVGFSRAQRFPKANDATPSPGPKYFPDARRLTNLVSPRYTINAQSALGVKASQELKMFKASFGDAGGPGAYTPRMTISKPNTARNPFTRADRFNPGDIFISKAHSKTAAPKVNANNPRPSPNQYGNPNVKFKRNSKEPRAPAFTFGPQDLKKVIHGPVDRVSFLGNPSATMQCGVGPSDYSSRVTLMSPKPTNIRFDRSRRFNQERENRFISHLHNAAYAGAESPGPKYFGDVIPVNNPKQPKSARLSWVP